MSDHSGLDDQTPEELFTQMSEQCARYGKMAGRELVPYISNQLPYFSKLDTEKKRYVLNALSDFLFICQSTIAHEKELGNSRELTWFALKHLNLRFRSDLFEKIEDTDLVEIYNMDNVQVFRNFNFLSFVSYTLEDIFCRPWTDLFHRPDTSKVTVIIDVLERFYNKKLSDTVSFSHMGTHRIEEVDSRNCFKYDAVIKYLSPIYHDDWSPFGFIAIESAQFVSESEASPEATL